MVTIDNHLTQDLSMQRATSDSSLYMKPGSNGLEGIAGNYVDDILNAGTETFQQETELTLSKFDTKPRVYDNLTFFGAQFKTVEPFVFKITQEHYVESLKTIATSAGIDGFR